ncbi:EAL domain-containing protein [Shewanella sp. WXL01]|uniref:sensor domain-containing phosphodiesterase n=1 Tax=Shewanella sp. WXL01 TaxID=2709721 RepID=UPI001438291F|nr:EAL domain-containing protein [Shewanella sp. WXL01]NKF50366.1 EAL domain-containing protein [Shewanella sp. WXL01]
MLLTKNSSLLNKNFDWKLDLHSKQFESKELVNIIYKKNSGSIPSSALTTLIDEHQIEQLKIKIKESIRNKKPTSCNLILNLDSERFLVAFNIIGTSDSEISGEITVLKRLLDTNQESLLLKEIFYHAERMLIICDDKMEVLTSNKMVTKKLGFKNHETIGQPVNILFNKEDSKYKELIHSCNTEKRWNGNIELFDTEGKPVPFELNTSFYFYKKNHTKLCILHLTPVDFFYDAVVDTNFKVCSWAWENKQQFFDVIDKHKELVNNDECMYVFMMNTFNAGIKNSNKLNMIIRQSLADDTTKIKYGLLNNNQISGICISTKIIKDIHKSITAAIDKIASNENIFESDLKIDVGISIFGTDASNNTELLGHSAQALLSKPDDKIHYNNHRICYYDKRVNSISNKRVKLQNELKKAIQNNTINVAYQPIVSLKNLKICSVEALARFEFSLPFSYSVQELIDIAEDADLIDKIDSIIAKKAISELSQLSEVLDNPNLGLSINHSMVFTKNNSENLTKTLATIKESHIDISRITIELTESSVFSNNKSVVSSIHKICNEGLKVSIDDFGSGYTSFDNLTKLPLNVIKIDKEITKGVDTDNVKQKMLKMFTNFIHLLNGQIVVEGVETISELNTLEQIGVDLIQGYFFCKPKQLNDHTNTPSEICKIIKHHNLTPTSNSNNISITNLCIPHVHIVEPDDRIQDFLSILDNDRVVAVVKNNKIQGVITPTNTDRLISPYVDTDAETSRDRLTLSKRAHQVMDKEYATCTTDIPINKLLVHFCIFPNSHMIVEGRNGIFLGLITFNEVKSLILDHLPLME